MPKLMDPESSKNRFAPGYGPGEQALEWGT